MTKKSILGFAFSTSAVLLATGAVTYFEGTHHQNPIMFPGYRELSAFAFDNVSWPMVGITFALMLVLALPWWATSLAEQNDPMPSRKFSLFPFLERRGIDRLITMLNVFSILGVTVSLLLMAQLHMPDLVPEQTNRLRLYLTALLIFWGCVYFLISFIMWRRGKNA